MTDEPRQEEPSAGGFGSARMTRLKLLKAGAAGVAGAAAGGALLAGEAESKEAIISPPTALHFLTQWEFDYVTAMAETIWPTDELGPGARVAGVGYYVDGQLAGSWGQGHRFYLNGPFYTPPDTGHGWQIPMTPAEVYRAFLPGFDVYCKSTYGNPYPVLPAATQTQALNDLQSNNSGIQIAGSAAFRDADFFSMFRQNVLEGMLSDPAYGGNRNMVGWKWLGYPGDPMRYGDPYHEYIFNNKPYPHEKKPLPLMPAYARRGAVVGAGATGNPPPTGTAEKAKKKMGGM
jgi:gluconate 2-dehydrogenase gamma chain